MMPQINIYRIDESKKDNFLSHLKEEYTYKGNRTICHSRTDRETGASIKIGYNATLYYAPPAGGKPLKWNWVLDLFGQPCQNTSGSPRGVILVDNGANQYAVTFGYSYFKVNQLCDKSWAFDYARRQQYRNIRTTALTNPSSQRNKTVNTYLRYEDLDFDSGEALTKLKAKVELPANFDLFAETVEFGNSLKFSCSEPTLEKIVCIIEHVNNVIATREEMVKIPCFQQLKDKEETERLNALLKQAISSDILSVDFSEYQIYATRIIFNEHHEYEYRYGRISMPCSTICHQTLMDFVNQNNLSIENDLLDVQIVVSEDGHSKFTTNIFKLLFYTNENEKALLTEGNWYRYNDDYLQYLDDSIREISVDYDEEMDYSREQHTLFLNRKFDEERYSDHYSDLSDDEVRKKIETKYYKEMYFNTKLIGKGYENFDRELKAIGKHKLEVMDLYKDQTMFTVKFGKSSSKLSYAIDQSLQAVQAYHKKLVMTHQNIRQVCLWLVLERDKLPTLDGSPDLRALNMLILKNRLDHWKKTIRLLGYSPLVQINYCRD